ncbi:MAG: type VI secretion system contractile sheath large subunit [Rhodocyclales bacterium]|nr:type VI secretion system contractile sheath large subunit [Rhodocyclales bacterium]
MSGNTPKLRITYDVETGGAIEKRELPFVVGILADLSGDPDLEKTPPLPFELRTMQDVDRDNFDDLMARVGPRVALDRIGSQLSGALAFSSLDEFSPARVADKLAAIDARFARQTGAVMSAENFQRLEASWRGMHYLVSRTATGTLLKLRVLNTSRKDLDDDLAKASDFDQSGLFKILSNAEFGTDGGTPYGLLVGDYAFGRSADDLRCLSKLAEVAAACRAPFIAAADAKLFDLPSFADLPKPRDLGKVFESRDLIEWHAFRDSEDSRYVTLTLPRVLLRLPHDVAAGAPAAGPFLWGNPAFVLAERIVDAFSRHGWIAAIRGVAGGGLVEGLPACGAHEGDGSMSGPTEVSIADRRARELNEQGFATIYRAREGTTAAFFGAPTVHRPQRHRDDQADSDARISASLPYVLAESRFAHYITAIMGNKIGSFLTRANVESYLNGWISQYVLLDDKAAEVVKAAYPLRAANVVVTDVPGRPGCYQAAVFLKPHCQFEESHAVVRFVQELPA